VRPKDANRVQRNVRFFSVAGARAALAGEQRPPSPESLAVAVAGLSGGAPRPPAWLVVFYRLAFGVPGPEAPLVGPAIHRDVRIRRVGQQLGSILTQVAVQDTRINRIETDIVELRHGKGFVREG
jgi:hypothetical protein